MLNVPLSGLSELAGLDAPESFGFDFAKTVNPTLDVLSLLLAQRTEGIATTTSQSAIDTFTFITVPNDEAWLTLAVGLNTDALDGDQRLSADINLALRQPDGTAVRVSMSTTFIPGGVSAVGRLTRGGVSFSPPIVVAPGMQWQANISDIVGGAAGSIPLTLNVFMRRLRV